jgi:diguanylate cyclase (GGDEF)-like protein
VTRALGWIVQGAAALVLLAYALHLLGVGPGSTGSDTWEYNSLLGVAALVCLARAALVPADRLAWTFLGAGLASWFAGELYFTLKLADLPLTPVPSISDYLSLAFYPASYVALILMVRARVRRFQASMWLDGLIGALAIGAAATAVFLEPILASTGRDTAEIAVSLAYPVGDTLLLALVAGFFAMTGWRPGRDWMLVGAGLAAMAIADVVFLYLSANGNYTEGTLLDAMWPASSLLLSFAALVSVERKQAGDMLTGVMMLIAPGVFAAGALALVVLGSISATNTTSLVLATAALGVVIVRLGLSLAENVSLLRDISRESVTDQLTGLGNRRKLIADLDELLSGDALESGRRTLGLFDLDGFKAYNDTYGHPAGDALLQTLGERLATAVRDDGRAYRLGGDEFCVVLDGDFEEAEIEAISDAGLTERGSGFSIRASCGRVVLPAEAATVSAALRIADTRLYQHKGRGGRASALKQAQDVLMAALSERAPDLDRHVRDVARLAVAVGERIGLEEQELLELGCAAQLHDVGKIAIPDAVLDKAGPLSDSEWKLMRSHPLVGDRIIRAAPMLAGVAQIVRSSHERWDGTGYPAGLAADAIPLGSRIIAVCDAFDAMTSQRPYQGLMETASALKELRAGAGSQFDPRVVDALCEEIEAHLMGAHQDSELGPPASVAVGDSLTAALK